jgi:F-type H+-transporting ATPase subunit epsilon
MPRPLKCRVVTPNGPLLEQEAVYVRFPAFDGLMGIMPGHAPLIATVGKGLLTVRGREDRAWYMEMEGGFVEVINDVVTVIAEQVGEIMEGAAGGRRELQESAARSS